MIHAMDYDALWKVLLSALVGGAGLVSVFSLALVGLSIRTSHRVLGWTVAGTCLSAVVLVVALGLYVMLAK
ncbi:hypothetical protein Misp01_46110 [Microtetraspora sp. NBRC 13810]|uniref:hypothetical protein n=1 Tax=Microtetraspora sp. NBRC 13810 TaxID=3030990 RepID=UPI0024A0826A|nr:hypothetical protein [Microtetraspora sp. NBRC 13810]GLW09482.1 hypothetical protein Misp01_46110 [Microtetraspora sp. NBRC 13810]